MLVGEWVISSCHHCRILSLFTGHRILCNSSSCLVALLMWHGYDLLWYRHILTILVVVTAEVRRSLMLLLVLLRRHHTWSTIVVGSSVHVRVEIGALIIVIGISYCVKAIATILLLLALERLAVVEESLSVVEVCARRIELLRRLKVLRHK